MGLKYWEILITGCYHTFKTVLLFYHDIFFDGKMRMRLSPRETGHCKQSLKTKMSEKKKSKQLKIALDTLGNLSIQCLYAL